MYLGDFSMRKKFVKLINNIQVDKIDTRELYDEASNQSRKDDKTILNQDNVYRWMVNAVRHSHTNYEEGLDKLHRYNYTENEYHMYKNAVLNKISHEYPNLAEECNKQKEPINMVKIITKKRIKNGKRKNSGRN